MNKKISYIEPKDAPAGVPCRFCDMPANTDGLGPVFIDGTAVDKKRPLFSHAYCLLNSGGLKQDNQDFSLQNLLPNNLKSDKTNNLDGIAPKPIMTASSEEDIWAFANKNRFFTANGNKIDGVDPAVQPDAKEEYADDGTGAPIPPSN